MEFLDNSRGITIQVNNKSNDHRQHAQTKKIQRAYATHKMLQNKMNKDGQFQPIYNVTTPHTFSKASPTLHLGQATSQVER